jgi:hypothetical protein
MIRPRRPITVRLQAARWILPAITVGCAVALVGISLYGHSASGIVDDLLVSALFFCLGLGLGQWRSWLSSPDRVFRIVFHLVATQRLPDEPLHESFYVIVPRFSLTRRAVAELDAAQLNRYERFENREIVEEHYVAVSALLAGNDAEAGQRLGSAIAIATEDQHRPVLRSDDEVQYDRPAIVLGFNTNQWVRTYWDLHKLGKLDALFLPTFGEVGILVRSDSDDSGYRKFLPLTVNGDPIPNFCTSEDEVDRDFGIFARVRGHHSRPLAKWLVCAGIGPSGTDGTARYVSDDIKFRRIANTFRSVDEFVIVFRVSARYPENAEPITCWPNESVLLPQIT